MLPYNHNLDVLNGRSKENKETLLVIIGFINSHQELTAHDQEYEARII